MSSAHHDHAFDGEPTNELPADEPRTPTWVPILGVCLFALAGVSVLASSDRATALPNPPTAEIKPEIERADMPARPAGPSGDARPTIAPGARPTRLPAPGASGTGRPVTKEQMEMLRKQMEQARARGALPTAPKPKP